MSWSRAQLTAQGVTTTASTSSMTTLEPVLAIPSSGLTIPQIAFGMYKVPADDDGVAIILNAIKVNNWEHDGFVLQPIIIWLNHYCQLSAKQLLLLLILTVWISSLRHGVLLQQRSHTRQSTTSQQSSPPSLLPHFQSMERRPEGWTIGRTTECIAEY